MNRRKGGSGSGLALALGGLALGLIAVLALVGEGTASARARRALKRRGGLGGLRSAVIGSPMHAVLSVFGPPPTTTAPPRNAIGGRPAYLQAEVWYYPLDPRRRRAMAVRFRDGLAHDVEFIRSPT
jgi:hypothetical protein